MCVLAASAAAAQDSGIRVRSVRVLATDPEAIATFYEKAFGMAETRRAANSATFKEIIINSGATSEIAKKATTTAIVIATRPKDAPAGAMASLILQVPAYVELRPIVKRNVVRRVLFCRDNWRCSYCGRDGGPRDLTVDHVKPLSRGGEHTWDNVVSACRRCNHRKGNRLPYEAGMYPRSVPKARSNGTAAASRRSSTPRECDMSPSPPSRQPAAGRGRGRRRRRPSIN